MMIFMNGREDLPEADSCPQSTDESRITRLERAGTIVRRGSGSPLDVLGQPVRTDADILSALLEERSEERNEGYR